MVNTLPKDFRYSMNPEKISNVRAMIIPVTKYAKNLFSNSGKYTLPDESVICITQMSISQPNITVTDQIKKAVEIEYGNAGVEMPEFPYELGFTFDNIKKNKVFAKCNERMVVVVQKPRPVLPGAKLRKYEYPYCSWNLPGKSIKKTEEKFSIESVINRLILGVIEQTGVSLKRARYGRYRNNSIFNKNIQRRIRSDYGIRLPLYIGNRCKTFCFILLM